MNPEEIRSFFEEHGYYHAKEVLDGENLEVLQADFDKIVKQLNHSGDELNARWENKEAMEKLGASSSKILHTNNVQMYSSAWMGALQSNAFLTHPKAILGNNIVLHHTKLFQKPSGVGAPFPIHQDWSYFPTKEDSMIAGIVHLTEATDEMGCLRVYPGSHKLGRLENANGQGGNSLSDYPLENATVIEAAAGDIIFFHYLTLHGSMPNRSTKTRKTVLIQLYSGTDVPESGIDHPNEKLVLSGWNFHASRSNTGQ